MASVTEVVDSLKRTVANHAAVVAASKKAAEQAKTEGVPSAAQSAGGQ